MSRNNNANENIGFFSSRKNVTTKNTRIISSKKNILTKKTEFLGNKLFLHKNRLHLSAGGSILLPPALKWGLFLLGSGLILPCLGADRAFAASITLTVPNDPISLNLAPSATGNFNKVTARDTIKISTDALAGYSLSINAKDGNTLNNSVTSDKINSLETSILETKFSSADNTQYNNRWGFSFAKNSVSDNKFYPINSQIGITDDKNDAEDIYSITLGARVDNTIATGTYSNTFVVIASANPVPYSITYNKNTDDTVTDMPDASVSGEQKAETETFELPADEPKRDNYAFIGWCTTKPTTANDIDSCDKGDFYKPNENFTLTSKNQVIALHAVWAKSTQVMQNWQGCDNLPQDYNTAVTLVDSRDSNSYEIIKFNDRCWMTQNLRLGGKKSITLSKDDTDFAQEEEFVLPPSLEQEFTNHNLPEVRINVSNPLYGGYYNWFTATAGKGTGRNEKGDLASSICPKGWRMPDYSEAEELSKTYDYNTAQTCPLKFLTSGGSDGNYPDHYRCFEAQCVSGYWWTSWADGDDSGFALWLFNNIFKLSNWGSGNGFSVRCVARD